MIEEAKKKTPKKLASKIAYALSDDQLSHLPKNYDLVYSNIVIQHIPLKRGYRIIEELLGNLDYKGFAALQITFTYEAPLFKRSVIYARNHFVPLHYLLNILRGNQWNSPRMRMHLYSREKISKLFKSAGITETIQLATDHGGYIGAMIIGQKKA